MRRLQWLAALALLFSLGPSLAVSAQGETWDLGLSRDFGYAGGGDIQGLFTMHVGEVAGLTQVRFLIDDEVVGTDSEAPFEFQFRTDDYPLGVHTLAAVGTLEGREEIRTPERTLEFVSADEGWKAVLRIVGPVLVIVVAATVVGVVGPLLLGRGKGSFQRGVYGAAGGSVCPRCGLPFSRHVFSPNVLIGKLERCPHCGRWSIVRQASRAELEAAEARLDADAQRGAIEVDDEAARLRREIDDSRFES